MATVDRAFGVVGLGRMGGNLALQALEKGMQVVGFTKGGASSELRKAGLTEVSDPSGFREHLKPPRPVLIYIPAGPIVDTVIEQLAGKLDAGDLIVDGGNSYWGDSIRRFQRLQARGCCPGPNNGGTSSRSTRVDIGNVAQT